MALSIRAEQVYLPPPVPGLVNAVQAHSTTTAFSASVTTGTSVAVPRAQATTSARGGAIVTGGAGANLVNVLSFGAVGNGVTDDTAAFQNAANASPGKTMYIPGGRTYRIYSCNIPANTVVNGDGATSVVKRLPLPSFSDARPVFDCKSNVQISNIKIDGNVAQNLPDAWADTYSNGAAYTISNTGQRGRGYRSGIRAEFVTNVTIDSVEITACSGAAVGTYRCRGITMRNVNVHDTQWEAGYIYGGGPTGPGDTTDITITNCTATNIHAPAGANSQGINPDCFVMSIARGTNFFTNNTLVGIDRDFVKLESPSNVTVSGNDGRSGVVGYQAVQIQNAISDPSLVSENVHIFNNYFEGPGWNCGFQNNGSRTLSNVVRNIEFDHNTIVSKSVGGSPMTFGIQFDGSVSNWGINLHDNDIWDTTYYALYITGGGNGLFCTNNRHNGVTMSNLNYPGTSPSGIIAVN